VHRRVTAVLTLTATAVVVISSSSGTSSASASNSSSSSVSSSVSEHRVSSVKEANEVIIKQPHIAVVFNNTPLIIEGMQQSALI
jgi:ABC-type enterochelin transport system substrate-binding protein